MPFTLLQGVFKPDAGVPDGDTVRFAPDNPDLLLALPRRGRSPHINTDSGWRRVSIVNSWKQARFILSFSIHCLQSYERC